MKLVVILLLTLLSIVRFTPSDIKISKEENEGIQLMREEEKLAHDVYVFLFDKWGIPVFNTISNSEIRHFNAIGFLIESFNLEDPSINLEGEFTNEELQQLYDSLIEKGERSVDDAFQVGAFIEETDIEDLQNLISKTSNDTIRQIYTYLLRASGNHLRAFIWQLATRNIDYKPQVLNQEQFNKIIETPHQPGGGRGYCIGPQKNASGCQNPGNGNKVRRRGRNF